MKAGIKPTPIIAVAMAALSIGCGSAGAGATADVAATAISPGARVDLSSPAAPGSAEPNLFTASDGRVYMSWIEPVGTDGGAPASTRRGRFAVRFATLDHDTWSAPRTIAESDEFFVNWADFPSIVESKGTLAVHWLQRSGPDTYAYDVRISRSTDGGETWTEPIVPHRDGTQTEHGFVSLVAEPDGGFSAIWLDGRDFANDDAEAPEMSLRGARFDADGVEGEEVLLDSRICDCCQTSGAYVGGNLLVAYRDRSSEEIRDITTVRRTPDGWQEPVSIPHDNWQIPGCPVNGPAVAGGDVGAIAWFSLRDGNPEIKVTFTHDGGATFSDPILVDQGPVTAIDDGNAREVARLSDASGNEMPVPLGRVDVEWVDQDTAAVSWIVARGNEADIVLQTVDTHGGLGDRHVVATTGSSRSSGFPRLARQGERLVLAWTEPGELSSIHTTVIGLPLQ